MHFKSLLTVNLPAVQPDPEWEKEVSEKIEERRTQKSNQLIDDVMLRIYFETMNNIRTAFGRELDIVVREVMERFYCGTEDKRYLEFEDCTEQYLSEYNALVTCIKFPDGRIVEEDSRSVWNKFIVQDGQVYQNHAGPLHHNKRTKKAKKMKALLAYPRKKLFKSFEDFVERECFGTLDVKSGRYGEWYNPDGMYDWYSIGGRWPDMFLVKTECKEYSYGERGLYDNEKYPSPEGYMWVACARKKDIQWNVMRQWRNQNAIEHFRKLEAMFLSGEKDETVHAITEEGIMAWGKLVYRKGQTPEEFLAVYGIPENWKYPISVHSIFYGKTCLEMYTSDTDSKTCERESVNSYRTVDEFIDKADNEDVFVGIDYHI